MKNWYLFLVFLFLSSFASYGQNANVYQHFSELKGMEDYNGNTNLFYRIYSYTGDVNNYNSQNNIYLFNVATRHDSTFQNDYSYYWDHIGGGGRRVADFKFWDNDPSKYIVCGVSWGDDPNGFIEQFGGPYYSQSFSAYSFLGISKQNDSLIYSAVHETLLKSTTGGKDWNIGNNFNAISLSPFNDSILFASENGVLYKTTDGGLSKSVADTIPATGNSTSLFYDKDSNYIYRTAYYYIQGQPVYKVLVSGSSGNANSWQSTFTSSLPIYLSVNNNVAGSVYMANGKNIYHSTDFGNTFNLFKSFEKNLVGIYKKPGSTKLYAATFNTIYELDGSAVNIVKQIPVDPEIFKFDPLDIGNKWVYNAKFFVSETSNNFVRSEEILRDSILENGQLFKLIRIEEVSSNTSSLYYSFRRIDSLTGKVYSWDQYNKAEYQIDDLSMSLGDTINVSRFGSSESKTSLDTLEYKNIFQSQEETRVYNSPISYLGYGDRYWLTKDIGMTYHLSSGDLTATVNNLKGAIIKGVVYGDTTFVVGVNDKVPVQPKEFALSQNYPNPFNPSTTIKYSLPKAGNVKLTIYNSIGGKVATVVNEYKTAGNYSVQFNGSNLASGIYLYRLESGNFNECKKFVLLK